MKVYDTANKLAEEIRDSEEYINFKKSKENLESNSDLKNKIQEFEKKRQEVQILAVRGVEGIEDKTKEIQEEYINLMNDENAKAYFESEMKFSILMADVNKIIGEAIKDVLK